MLNAPSSFRGQFHADASIRAAYSEGAGPYRIVPAAVAIPADFEDLRRLVDYAGDHRQHLIPRGAGSGIPGNNVGSGIIVDLRRLSSPLTVSADGIANVGAAVTWAALDREASARGYRLGPNPSSGHSCTLGGMIATNASGARTVRTGSIRRWIRGLELVTADGEIGWFGRTGQQRSRRTPVPGQERSVNPLVTARQRFDSKVRLAVLEARDEITARFPRTRKNSAGYALDEYLRTGELVDLVIGSEGTLGFITRASLQLERVPAATSSVLIALREAGALPAAVGALLGLEPSAVEMMDRTLFALAGEQIPFPLDGVEVILLVDFERTNPAAAESAIAGARAALGSSAVHFGSAIEPDARERLWALRHAASPALASLPPNRRSLQVVEDGCVPVEVLDRYLHGIRNAAAKHGVEVVIFGHAGDGHLHVNALSDVSSPGFEERLSALYEDVTRLVVELGGTPSGEHGDGRLRAPALERVYGKRIAGLFRDIKRVFDPRGIFNPGVIVPAPDASPLGALKVGSRAQPIPPEIESRLREMERTARWGVPKTDLANRQAVVTT